MGKIDLFKNANHYLYSYKLFGVFLNRIFTPLPKKKKTTHKKIHYCIYEVCMCLSTTAPYRHSGDGTAEGEDMGQRGDVPLAFQLIHFANVT